MVQLLGGTMSTVQCEINGVPGFIVRTDKNKAGLGDHPPVWPRGDAARQTRPLPFEAVIPPVR